MRWFSEFKTIFLLLVFMTFLVKSFIFRITILLLFLLVFLNLLVKSFIMFFLAFLNFFVKSFILFLLVFMNFFVKSFVVRSLPLRFRGIFLLFIFLKFTFVVLWTLGCIIILSSLRFPEISFCFMNTIVVFLFFLINIV